jgi:hypothetical protein
LKVLDTIKANLKVPHPTLVAVGISATITAIIVGIFALADSGLFGQEAAEASARRNGRINRN